MSNEPDWSDPKWLDFDVTLEANSPLTRDRLKRLFAALPCSLGHPVSVRQGQLPPEHLLRRNSDRLYVILAGKYTGSDGYTYGWRSPADEEKTIDLYEGALEGLPTSKATLSFVTISGNRLGCSISLAKCSKNTIAIYVDLFHPASDADDMKFTIKEILAWAIPKLELSPWLSEEDRAKAEIAVQINGLPGAIHDHRRDELGTIASEIQETSYNLTQALRKQAEIMALVSVLLSPEQIEKKTNIQLRLMEGLLGSGDYSAIKYTDGCLVGTASPAILQGRDFGNWDISINLQALIEGGNPILVIKFIYLSGGAKHGDLHHPHILGNGSPCFGDLTPDMIQGIALGQVMELFVSSRVFLNSYNPRNPYAGINLFLPIDGAVVPCTEDDEICDDEDHDDEDSDPCEDCGDYGTPHCAHECRDRSSDDCERCGEMENGAEECLSCVFNTSFEQYNPCESCDDRSGTTCLNNDCTHQERAIRLSISISEGSVPDEDTQDT